MLRNFTLFLALILLSFSGCSGKLYKFLPQSKGTQVTDVEKVKLCEQIAKKDLEIETLRLLLKVKISYGSEVTQLRYAILLGESNQIKIEALPPSGAYALAVLLIVDGKTGLVNVVEKTATFSNDSPSLFRKFFDRVPINIDELKMLVRGRATKGSCENSEISSKDGSIFISTKSGTELLELNHDDLSLKRIFVFESSSQDPILLGVIRNKSSDSLPNAWELLLESPSLQMEANTIQVRVNTKIDKELFSINIPNDFKILSEY